jgi:trehalose 6-phosphate phosphatase
VSAAEASNLLARLAAEPEQAAILLDVDGTLAPIVARPELARVPEGTRGELARLARAYALVACVSGRPSAQAREIVGVDGVTYVGEHGLELDPESERWSNDIEQFLAEVDLPVERKRLSASFHFREADDPEAARAELERVADGARAAGLRPRWGRMVLEIRPPVDADKGTATRRLLEQHGLRRALYAGDDQTDLDAFRGLDGLELAVRVAVASTEGPSELGRQADLVVTSTEALLELLRRL